MPLNEKFVTAKTLSLNKIINSKWFSFNMRRVTSDRLVFLDLEAEAPKLPAVFLYLTLELVRLTFPARFYLESIRAFHLKNHYVYMLGFWPFRIYDYSYCI